ncbi:ethanolamine utilization protein EutH [Clostridioides difficile]
MSINEIIIYVMVVFMVLGAIDKCIGNKFGLGEQFEEGIMAMGSLAVAMVGVICLAPVLADVLRPIVVPVFNILGADPAMFAGSLLANDMGGAPLALELAKDPNAGLFGGLVAGFEVMMVLRNLVPIIIFAVVIALGLLKFENAMIKGFTYFGKGVVIVITLGLAAAIVEALTGIVVIPGMKPISEGIEIVGDIAIVLAGAFPLVFVITKVFNKPLMALGKVLGMNDVSAAGLVASLANCIPMFGMMKDMDNRGKIINVAFSVSAAFVFGDHLGFTAGFNSNMITPMIVAKLVGGITAVLLAMVIANKTLKKENV